MIKEDDVPITPKQAAAILIEGAVDDGYEGLAEWLDEELDRVCDRTKITAKERQELGKHIEQFKQRIHKVLAPTLAQIK